MALFTRKPTNGQAAAKTNGAAAPEPDDIDTVEWLLLDRLKLIDERAREVRELLANPEGWASEVEYCLRKEQAQLAAERHATELALRKERNQQEPMSPALAAQIRKHREEQRAQIAAQIEADRERKLWQIQKWTD